MGAAIDEITAEELVRDPYEVYRRLRDACRCDGSLPRDGMWSRAGTMCSLSMRTAHSQRRSPTR